MQNTPQYKQLQEALAVLEELKIPENLQRTALEHLLGHRNEASKSQFSVPNVGTPVPMLPIVPNSSSLRTFIADLKPKGAVSEIPCLFYWSKSQENVDSLSEESVVQLYRRAGLRPPKNVLQSLRDLCSRKYGRLESVGNSQFKLSRTGEDFVLHDVKGAA